MYMVIRMVMRVVNMVGMVIRLAGMVTRMVRVRGQVRKTTNLAMIQLFLIHS